MPPRKNIIMVGIITSRAIMLFSDILNFPSLAGSPDSSLRAGTSTMPIITAPIKNVVLYPMAPDNASPIEGPTAVAIACPYEYIPIPDAILLPGRALLAKASRTGARKPIPIPCNNRPAMSIGTLPDNP